MDAPVWIVLSGLFGVLLQVIVAPLVAMYVTERVKASATKHVQKELEEHRHTLEKRFQDFSLFTAKRHEVYAELFQLVSEAQGQIGGLSGGVILTTYEDYTKENIEEELKTIRMVGEVSAKIIGLWDQDRKAAANEMQEAMRRVRRDRADAKVMEAQEYSIVKALYLTTDVETLVKTILQDLHASMGHALWPDQGSGMKQLQLKEEAKAAVDRLKELMRTELSLGASEAPALAAGTAMQAVRKS